MSRPFFTIFKVRSVMVDLHAEIKGLAEPSPAKLRRGEANPNQRGHLNRNLRFENPISQVMVEETIVSILIWQIFNQQKMRGGTMVIESVNGLKWLCKQIETADEDLLQQMIKAFAEARGT